ncbi:methionine adenosyltransferase [Streptomyces sp. NPDC002886]|uniref:methionine adenosyltransferase n=1 Tax=Streptomyces sp. NPDC002886 TaxID=3364667 RepID=UPI0036740ED6
MDVELVERKGTGHPDTIADAVANEWGKAAEDLPGHVGGVPGAESGPVPLDLLDKPYLRSGLLAGLLLAEVLQERRHAGPLGHEIVR